MEPRYLNPFHRVANPYFAVSEIQELKKYFDHMAPLWACGLDKPTIADRMCYEAFKGSFGVVHNATHDIEEPTNTTVVG